MRQDRSSQSGERGGAGVREERAEVGVHVEHDARVRVRLLRPAAHQTPFQQQRNTTKGGVRNGVMGRNARRDRSVNLRATVTEAMGEVSLARCVQGIPFPHG
eukprot:551938-Rhodomonas_salina.2